MKEFIDKLISRLEEARNRANRHYNYGDETAYRHSIEIVNQLAEEYNNESVKGDLISRSLLLKAIDECLEDCENHMTEPSVWNVIGIIKRQPTAGNDGWIPASERLPGEKYIICIEGAEFYKHVLTTTQDENAQCCVGWYDQEDETWYDLEGFTYHPIAWQPLPPKYEPKGE